MTYLDALYDTVKSDDKDSLIEWLIDFAYWCDPGGYFDKSEIYNHYLYDEKCTHWVIDHSQDWITPGGDPVWVCSNCGGGLHVYGIESYNKALDTCPNCGRKMMYDYNEG